MFEGLKKKFSDFVGSFTKKEEEKIEAEAKAEEKVEEKKEAVKPEAQFREEVKSVRKEEREQIESRAKEEIKVQAKKAPDVTIATKLKGVFLREVKIGDKDIEPFLEQLKMSLLQTDVNYDVAEKITGKMRSDLVGSKIQGSGIAQGIKTEIRGTLLSILTKNAGFDLLKMAQEKKAKKETPFTILFLGPNGAGKTTTIAKVASMFNGNGIRCVISASDTFRAAAVEQAAIHAKRIGTDIIKGKYGADPASVAFDAIAYAKAHMIDAVLIDTAGRQETNRNLIEELRKMVRVNKPNVSIFVGESIAGNALLEQVKEFDEVAKVTGIILTKLDCDAKGGNTLSILSETHIPVIYFGIGEKYSDLMQYNPEFVVNNIMPN